MSVLRPNVCRHGKVQRAASLSAQTELSCWSVRARIDIIIGRHTFLSNLTLADISTRSFTATEHVKTYASGIKC